MPSYVWLFVFIVFLRAQKVEMSFPSAFSQSRDSQGRLPQSRPFRALGDPLPQCITCSGTRKVRTEGLSTSLSCEQSRIRKLACDHQPR